MKLVRTNAQRMARMASEKRDMSLEHLMNIAIRDGVFPKPGTTDENYSSSWIDGRLRLNDMNVAEKLQEYSIRNYKGEK